jgi:hypothetical protein
MSFKNQNKIVSKFPNIMKYIIFFVSLCFVFISPSSSARDYPVPGVDDYEDMISMLGRPRTTEITLDGYNYIYPDVSVNISGKSAPIILSISFWQPNVYKKYPDLDVGMTLNQIRSKLSDFYEHHGEASFIADYNRGIIFWLEKDRVIKLVQVKRGSLKRIK